MTYGYEFELEDDQVQFVKSIRCVHGYSWGAVAREFLKKWPMFKDRDGRMAKETSMCGAALCDAAMDQLHETVESGWN